MFYFSKVIEKNAHRIIKNKILRLYLSSAVIHAQLKPEGVTALYPEENVVLALIQFKSITVFPTPKDIFSICSNCLHF